jgi:hypothetical protein
MAATTPNLTWISQGRYYDRRIMHMFTGGLTPEEIEESLEEAVAEAGEILGLDYLPVYRFSLNRAGDKTQGYGYVFFHDYRIANLLAGLPPESTSTLTRHQQEQKRLEDEKKRQEKEKKRQEEEKTVRTAPTRYIPGVTKWADIEDDEEEEEEEEEEEPAEPEIPPPEIEWKQYTYTPQQKEDHKRVLMTTAAYEMYREQQKKETQRGGTLNLRHDEIIARYAGGIVCPTIPDVFSIQVSFANVSAREDDPTVKANSITALRVPSWVTKDMIFDELHPLNSSTKMKTVPAATPRGYPTQVSMYPEVIIREGKDGNTVEVVWDPTTRDARMALQVMKHVTIVNPRRTTQKAELVFRKTRVREDYGMGGAGRGGYAPRGRGGR